MISCKKYSFAVFLLLALTVFASCHRKPRTDELSDAAACYVAELYYGYLADNKVDKYVSFIGSSEITSEEYCAQMAMLVKEYLANLQQTKGGILKAQAAGDSIWGNEAQVYLDVLYGDSTCERVDMPLFFENNQWRMR